MKEKGWYKKGAIFAYLMKGEQPF